MATLNKEWNDGGSLSVSYEGDGDGSAVFSSDDYEGIDRVQSVIYRDSGKTIAVEEIVRQTGIRQPIGLAGGGIFRLANGGRFGVLKQGGVVPPAPVETYTRLTYIESTGAQYINTGYVVQEDDTITINYSLVDAESGRLYGAGGDYDVYFSFSDGKAYVRFGQSSSTSINRGACSNYSIVSKGKVTINTWSASLPFIKMPTTPLYLFAFCEEDLSASSFATIQCHGFRINDKSGNLIIDMLPYRRESDGKVGMLDSVSGKFYGSESDVDFLGGSAMILPNDYEVIDGAEFNADKAFDLLKITQDNRIEVSFQRSSTSSSDYLYGVLSSGNTASVTAYCASNGAWRFGSQLVRPNAADKDVHKMSMANGLAIYDGVETKFTANNFTTPTALILGGYRDTNESIYKTFKGTIFFFRIWVGDILTMELIPCRRLSDGVEGFWDCVMQTFVESL